MSCSDTVPCTGAALGPLLAGLISPTGWSNVFYMLISADVLACLVRLLGAHRWILRGVLSRQARTLEVQRIVHEGLWDSSPLLRTTSSPRVTPAE